MVFYVITSMIGMLPIPWTMTAELFPMEIRGIAHSIAYSAANGLMFASVQSYVSLEHLFGGVAGVQWFFAVVALMGLIYAFVFLPETHGKKLSVIVDYFNYNTIYLGQKSNKQKETGEHGDGDGTPRSPERKPIVKSSRVSKEDLDKSTNGQNKNLIESA